MRRIILVSCLWAPLAQGQTYCETYSEGYADGWCEDYPAGACPPAPPSGCMTVRSDVRGAYERGYHQGAEDADFEVAPQQDEEE